MDDRRGMMEGVTNFPGIPDDERALRNRYRAFEKSPQLNEQIRRLDGYPINEVEEDFFLIKFSDPFAKAALLAYAEACASTDPKLAADLRRKLNPNYLDQTRKRLMSKGTHPIEG